MTDRQSRIVALIVGRSSSRCSDCGGSAIPSHGDDHAHVMTSGWDQKPGCGATWTHITTDCAGDGIEANVRALAPHLPWIDYGDVVRQSQREPLTGAAGELLADHRQLRATLAAGGIVRGPIPAEPELDRLRAQLAEVQEDLEGFREWSNELAGHVPDDQEVADPEGTQEGIISAWVEHLVADRGRLRTELHSIKADPVTYRASDGTVTVDWPEGARSCLIARELLDEMVSDGNRTHGDFSAARTAFLRTNSALRQVTEAADALLNRLLKAAPQDEHSATLAAGLARTLDQHRDKIDPTPYTPEYLPPHPEVERLRGLLAEAIDVAEDIGTWGVDGTEQATIARIKRESGLT